MCVSLYVWLAYWLRFRPLQYLVNVCQPAWMQFVYVCMYVFTLICVYVRNNQEKQKSYASTP